MSWTIRSKSEKTSLASTDGVPMQEAGGTTKWFSLSSLSSLLGITGAVARKADSTSNFRHDSGDFSTIGMADPTLSNAEFLVSGAVTSTPINNSSMWHITRYSWSVDAPNFSVRFVARAVDPGRHDTYERHIHNGTWDNSGVYNGWTPLTDAAGNSVFPTVATTASAANAYIAGSGNTILQSTSSAKYKTDIVTLDDSSTLDRLRPVLYKSNPETVPGDDPTKEHYGFIAEELHEIDEKLVQYVDDVPNGVQYDRITVLLVKRIHELEARLAKAGI